MPCPYGYLNFDDTKNVEDHEDSDGSIVDELPIATKAMNGVGNHHQVIKEAVNYATYLRTDVLLSALKCLSHTDPLDNNSPPIHDEHFFILIHQVFELWFKQLLFEIDSIRRIFVKSDDIISSLFNINLRLKRSVNILNILIDQLELLESMTPIEFLEFREYLTSGSGFQSLQFRIIEMKLGLTDRFRSSYKTKYFTETMFNGVDAVELKQAVNEESLLIGIERWLEHIYDNTSFNFLIVFTSSVERFIEHERKQKIMNGIAVEVAERDAETLERKFATMIDPNEYKKLLDNNERRISHKAMLTALMISLYHQQPCFQQAYQMLGLLMDIDALMSSWRHKHVLLVLRQIGRKPGTGGTDGISYLQQTVTDKYQVFIDLFNLSSYLIPQRFLPKFVDKFNQSTPSLSSFTLEPHREVPAVYYHQAPTMQNQSLQVSIQYSQILFFLFLFVTGWIFATFTNRFLSR